MADTNGDQINFNSAQREQLETVARNMAGKPIQPTLNAEDLKRVSELVNNATAQTRRMFAQMIDPRRDINGECGYPDWLQIGPDLYRDTYESQPIAHRVVQLMPMECWSSTPMVYEDEDADSETPFEAAWDELGKTLRGTQSWYDDELGSAVWEHLRRVDILSGIGSCGLLLLGIDDGKDLQLPVEGSVNPITNSRGTYHIADSPMRWDEYEAITNPKPQQRWTGKWKREGIGEDAKSMPVINNWTPPPLTDEEQRIVENWKAERETVDEWRGYYKKDDQGKKTWQPGLTTNQKIARIEHMRASETLDQFKDRTDNLQTTPGGPSMWSSSAQTVISSWAIPAVPSTSPTDQQYFGVQFGPVEIPSDKPTKPHKLLFLRAFDESLFQVVRYEWNVKSPRFGMPVMYRITLNDPREIHSGIGLPMATVYVHWTRIIHVADNLGSSEIFGVPRLRPNFRPVSNYDKVTSAGSEGYWKNAFSLLQFSSHPQLGGDVDLTAVGGMQGLRDIGENVQNSLQRILLGIGGKWEYNSPEVVDPTPHIEAAIEAICICLGCPVRVFKGAERGELASTQDDSDWNGRVMGRQNNYLTPKLICAFIDRLIALGVLPEPGSGDKRPARVSVKNSKRVIADYRKAQREVEDLRKAIVNSKRVLQDILAAQAIHKRVSVTNAQSKFADMDFSGIEECLVFVENVEKRTGGSGSRTASGSPSNKTKGGYKVEWPDLEALSDKDKAAIFLQRTQAWAAYVAGGLEAVVAPVDFATRFDDFDEEEAHEMCEAASSHQEEALDDHGDKADAADEHDLEPMPPPGFEKKPPPAPGMPGGPPLPEPSPIAVKPGEKLVHPASVKPPAGSQPPKTTENHEYDWEELDDDRTDNYDPSQTRGSDGKWAAGSSVAALKAMHESHPDAWDQTGGEINRHADTLATLPKAEVVAAAKHLFGDGTVAALLGTKSAIVEHIRQRFQEDLYSTQRNKFR